MKTKSILFFVVCALLTLSFTFASVRGTQSSKETQPIKVVERETNAAPIGGFVSEDI